MEDERTTRLKMMLEQALSPIMERLDKIEADIQYLKEQSSKQ